MLQRQDGIHTRQKIFEVACRVFGKMGYRAATHAMICEAAGTNIAAINYHFGSKENLYREVCTYALGEISAHYPLDREQTGKPEDRLRAFIATLLARGGDREPLSFYHQLRMHESRESSGVAQDLWDDWFQEHRDALHAILRELLQEAATPDNLLRCQISVVGPCFMVNFVRVNPNAGAVPRHSVSDMESLLDHIVSFSLAGIAALRAEYGGTTPRAKRAKVVL